MMTLFMMSLFKNLFENDVIIKEMKSAGINLLNQYSFRHTKPFSFLDKSTGPILPFVVLALYFTDLVFFNSFNICLNFLSLTLLLWSQPIMASTLTSVTLHHNALNFHFSYLISFISDINFLHSSLQ